MAIELDINYKYSIRVKIFSIYTGNLALRYAQFDHEGTSTVGIIFRYDETI